MNFDLFSPVVAWLAGLAALATLTLGIFTVAGWREDAARLRLERTEFAQYRADVATHLAERDRRRKLDDAITESYLAKIDAQNADLRRAREQLRAIRLHVGACPAVPAQPATGPATAGTDEKSPDRQPDLVAGSISAEAVAERFAVCDDTGARLNALIDRTQQQASSR